MPTPINPSQFPEYIYGIHDIGGHDRMLQTKRRGWVLDTIDLRSQSSATYSTLAEKEQGVIVCLNHGDDSAGTIPPSDQYDTFAASCAAHVKNSPGARVWLIGNEMNTSAERPQLPDGSREIITPQKYAHCFAKCRSAIKGVPGHANDLVIPGAVGPYNAETGDWVRYLVDVLVALENQVDGIALHCYTHEFVTAEIVSDDMMAPPFGNRHFNFRAYRDFLGALPTRFRSLPVFITKAYPCAGWRNANIGWIQAAYREIADWNSDPAHQPIQALVLFRWHTLADHPEWGIADKPALIDDFDAALDAGYRVRWPSGAPAKSPGLIPASPHKPPPITGQYAARFLAHDTPVVLLVGQTLSVNLRLKNVGTALWKQGGDHPVHLGYKWFNAEGKPQLDVDDRRTALPTDVLPSHETSFSAVLAVPKTPGTYTLRWDLVAEGITWFADAGNSPLMLPVGVSAVPQDIGGWRAESNLNVVRVAHALDGDPTTCWDSGVPQTVGQWFRLNLSTPRCVDGIQFLSPGNGFPSSYCLRISSDGKTWSEIARAAADNPYNVMAVFAPQIIQFAQIDLLAPAPASWMISEIQIHVAATWTASASHNSAFADHAIDNSADTAWSSGVPQAPGMWFQIDLGRLETVSGLSLESPADEIPVNFRISVWNANTNHWRIVCDQSKNTASVQVSFEAVRTQFVNIQLTQAAEHSWTIRHARVIREMDTWLGPAL